MLAQTASVAVLLAVALPAVSAKASPGSFDVQPDFGFCVPTLKYEGGLGGRSDDDFAFLAADPVITQDGKESTNPSESMVFGYLARAMLIIKQVSSSVGSVIN